MARVLIALPNVDFDPSYVVPTDLDHLRGNKLVPTMHRQCR
jgi:hypothetical protein